MNEIWSFEDICVLLNSELSDWIKETRTPRIYKRDPEAHSSTALYTFTDPTDFNSKIHIHFDTATNNIDVAGTLAWLKHIYQAAKTIRRFSHYKNKAEIIEYVRTAIQHED